MRVELAQGDITVERVDAIVNAANSSLLGGGGVDGAIHRAAGSGLLAECRELRRATLPDGLPVGEAVATGGHALSARWVIHTVGPDARRGQTDPALLESCYRSSLRLAAELGATSIAFPAISAGVYAWPLPDAAGCAARAIAAFRETESSSVELVRMVLFSQRALEVFTATFRAAGLVS